MIWATAKSTEVSSPQMPRPARANTLGSTGLDEAAGIAAGVAMVSLRRRRAPAPPHA